jgi:hypothetical protein
MPLFPSQMFLKKSFGLFPFGVMAPSPVTTTRFKQSSWGEGYSVAFDLM